MVYETAISIGVVLSAFILVYIGTKIQGKGYTILQSLFLIVAIWVLFSHLTILSIIADNESEPGIQAILQGLETVYFGIGLFLIFYFAIMVFTGIIDMLRKNKERKKNKFEVFDDD